ncbi:MAG: hypothetical protein LBT59_11160 [Clostridiales bacterium]|jgi:hypothetical protein|nr:hypothetical protein [Clostridiales bacterium]
MKILKSAKVEAYYLVASKSIFLFTGLLLSIFIIVLLLSYNSALEAYNRYERNLAMNDINMDSDDYQPADEINNVIVNPLAYNKHEFGLYSFSISPGYIVGLFLESLLLVSPFVFSSLGAFIFSYDRNCKTEKFKVSSSSKLRLYLSKQVTLSLSILFVLLVSLIVSSLAGSKFHDALSAKIPIDIPDIGLQSVSNIFQKFAFGLTLAVFFGEVGCLIGQFTGNWWTSFVLGIMFSFVFPHSEIPDIYAKIDFRLAISNIGLRIYDFIGVVSYKDYHFPLSNSILYFSLVFVIVVFLGVIVSLKKSAYNY